MMRNILINSIVSGLLIIGAFASLSHATLTTHTENSCAVTVDSWSGDTTPGEYIGINPFGGSALVSATTNTRLVFNANYSGAVRFRVTLLGTSDYFDESTGLYNDYYFQRTYSFPGTYTAGSEITGLNFGANFEPVNESLIVGMSIIIEILTPGLPADFVVDQVNVNDNATTAQSGTCLH